MGDLDAEARNSAKTRSPRARFLQRTLALALGTSLTIVVAELGYRVWRSVHDQPYDGAAAELRLDEFVQRLKGLDFAPREAMGTSAQGGIEMSLHPYQGYQVAQAWTDADSPYIYYTSQRGLENYDVLLLGGSVAAGFGNWANLVLVPLLQADPRLAGRKIRVHNRACPGHKQPQLTTNLEWAISLGIRPDAVLLLDGFNDIAVASENTLFKVHPLFPSWWQMEMALSGPLSDPDQLEVAADIFALRQSAEELAARARRWKAMRSAALGGFIEREFALLDARSATLLAQLETISTRREKELPPFLRGPSFANDAPTILRVSGRAWMEGSRSMQASCRARGIHFVHVLQPAARDKGSKPLTAKEEEASFQPQRWRLAIEEGYPRLRDAGAQLAREGINFHDGSRVFADHPEEIYKDACHFGEEGFRILGEFVAHAFLESLPKE